MKQGRFKNQNESWYTKRVPDARTSNSIMKATAGDGLQFPFNQTLGLPYGEMNHIKREHTHPTCKAHNAMLSGS